MATQKQIERAAKTVIKELGGPKGMAKIFNPPISYQAVMQWKAVPVRRCKDIERHTKGKWTAERLRPDFFL